MRITYRCNFIVVNPHLRVHEKLLLLEELIKCRQRVPLIPPTAFGHEHLARGIDRVNEVKASQQRRQEIVARRLVPPVLRYELTTRLSVARLIALWSPTGDHTLTTPAPTRPRVPGPEPGVPLRPPYNR